MKSSAIKQQHQGASEPIRNRFARPGWEPFETLWTRGESLFPSRSSANWFIQRHRDALLESNALASHTNRTFIHLERFGEVVEKIAIQLAKQRHEADEVSA